MNTNTIRFDDGDDYEAMMGVWSRMVGTVFLDWLAPPGGLAWIDVGCGTGAFTHEIAARCAPSEIHGIDPSPAQLEFARERAMPSPAHFHAGDATALPFPENRFDAAVMALVLFFVPDPALGLSEMMRVVRKGGLVSAYVWDVPGAGLPVAPIHAAMRALGIEPTLPPSAAVSRMAALEALWRDAGLSAVRSRVITARRSYADFDAFWSNSLKIGNIGQGIARLAPAEADRLREETRARLTPESDGRITIEASANAVAGIVPG